MPALIPNNKKIWLAAKEGWPVLGVIGFAIGWCGYKLARAAVGPDSSFAPSGRATVIKDIEEKAVNWRKNTAGYIAVDPSQIRILGSYKNKKPEDAGRVLA